MYGVLLSSVSLILSYLYERNQYLYKDGQYSLGRKVEHGIPHGSRLGPLIFNIYK